MCNRGDAEAGDLLRRLLAYNDSDRLLPIDALQHPYFSTLSSGSRVSAGIDRIPDN